MSYQKPVLSLMEMAVASSCCTNPDCQVSDPCTYTVQFQSHTVCISSTQLRIQ
jgi:hypothetical protein